MGAEGHSAFVDFGFRPAYHDVLDPVEGYTKGAQLKFASLDFRYLQTYIQFLLKNFIVMGIKSITPINRYLKPLSWEVNFGFHRKQKDKTLGRFRGGPGLSYAFNGNITSYFLFDGIVEDADQLKNFYAGGLSLNGGLLAKVTKNWSMPLNLVGTDYLLGDKHARLKINWEQRYKLNLQNTLRLTLEQRKEFNYNYSQIELSW